jgi:hypothetical protein
MGAVIGYLRHASRNLATHCVGFDQRLEPRATSASWNPPQRQQAQAVQVVRSVVEIAVSHRDTSLHCLAFHPSFNL